MRRTFVVIPVRGQWHLTERCLASLAIEPVHDVLVLDNASEDDTRARIRELSSTTWRKLHVKHSNDRSIYESWNEGFARARRLSKGEPFNALMLNNDVRLETGSVQAMSNMLTAHPQVWVSYPDYTRRAWPTRGASREGLGGQGVAHQGGLYGPCFMLAGERIPWEPLITDPAYEHWYGDDHLAECILEEGGVQGRVLGLSVEHLNQGTARHHPELHAVKLADHQAWLIRHTRGLRAIDRRA